MSVYFALWAEQVWVVRRGPGARLREWQIRMFDEPEHGVIEVGSDVRAGDEIYKNGVIVRRRKTGRVVADVDWDRQAHLKRGVITWAGTARIRANQKEAKVALNFQLHGTRLLDWLYDQDVTEPSFHDVNQFVAESDLSDDGAQLVVDDLESRGVIEQIATFGSWEAKLTVGGADFVQKVRAERSDSVRRSREIQQRMLCWLHNREHRDAPPSDWSDFLASDDAIFYGDRFALAELERQAEYLFAKDLIQSLHIEQAADGTIKPRLTAAGQDCVMDFGGNVSDYINRHNGRSTTTNITMTGSTGNIVVASDNVQQNIETGIDTRKLLDFAGFVRQVVPTLGLSEDDQAELDADAAELHQAAEEAQPDRGRIKQLHDAVMAGLIKAAPSIVTSTATAMGNDAIRAITGH